MAAYVSRPGGTSAVIPRTGVGAFGKSLESEIYRHGVVTVSDGSSVERVAVPGVRVENVTGARDASWPALLTAHEVVETQGRVKRRIDRDPLYDSPARQRA